MHVHAFTVAVIFELFAVDSAHTEVLRDRMREVQTANRTRRDHGVIFRELNSGIFLRVKQIEQRSLLCVIRQSGIARRRADSTIALADQVLRRQVLTPAVPPLLPRPLMQPLGQGFGETVGERLRHD